MSATKRTTTTAGASDTDGYRTIRVHRVAGDIGAEITGIRVGGDLQLATVAELRAGPDRGLWCQPAQI